MEGWSVIFHLLTVTDDISSVQLLVRRLTRSCTELQDITTKIDETIEDLA